MVDGFVHGRFLWWVFRPVWSRVCLMFGEWQRGRLDFSFCFFFYSQCGTMGCYVIRMYTECGNTEGYNVRWTSSQKQTTQFVGTFEFLVLKGKWKIHATHKMMFSLALRLCEWYTYYYICFVCVNYDGRTFKLIEYSHADKVARGPFMCRSIIDVVK